MNKISKSQFIWGCLVIIALLNLGMAIVFPEIFIYYTGISLIIILLSLGRSIKEEARNAAKKVKEEPFLAVLGIAAIIFVIGIIWMVELVKYNPAIM